MYKEICLLLLVLMVAVAIDAQNKRNGPGGTRIGNGRAGNGRTGNGRAGNGRTGIGRAGNGRTGNGRGLGSRGQGGQERGKGKFQKFRKQGLKKYFWNVKLSSGPVVTQRAFSIPDKGIVITRTRSKALRALNMSNSVVLMNTTTGKMVMKAGIRGGPCYLQNFSDGKDKILRDLDTWNNTEISQFAESKSLNGSGSKMASAEVDNLFAENHAFRPFCYSVGVVETSVINAPIQERSGTKTLTFLGYNSQVALLVKASPAGRPGRRPREARGGQGGRPGGQGSKGRGPILGTIHRGQSHGSGRRGQSQGSVRRGQSQGSGRRGQSQESGRIGQSQGQARSNGRRLARRKEERSG